MLFVECYPDELLVRILGVPRRAIRHACGKGNIFNRLRQLEAGTGLIDEDPGAFQPPEWRNYRAIQRVGNLLLTQHVAAPARQVVVICPRLEEWLYDRASHCQINPTFYGLPQTAAALKKISRYDKRPRFREFLECLHACDKQMQCLAKWVTS